MDKIECTTAERETLHYWRFYHPHPRVQLKMEALYLKSQGLAPEDPASAERVAVLLKEDINQAIKLGWATVEVVPAAKKGKKGK